MSDFDMAHALAVASRVDGADAKLVALLHDAIEDGHCTEQDLWDADMPDEIVLAVCALTRTNESYDSYIQRLRNAGNELAIYVKLADLDANLSRMDEEHSSLTGRYRKAQRDLQTATATAVAPGGSS